MVAPRQGYLSRPRSDLVQLPARCTFPAAQQHRPKPFLTASRLLRKPPTHHLTNTLPSPLPRQSPSDGKRPHLPSRAPAVGCSPGQPRPGRHRDRGRPVTLSSASRLGGTPRLPRREGASHPGSPPYLPAAAARGLQGAAAGHGAPPTAAPHVGDPPPARRRRARLLLLLRAAGRGQRPPRRFCRRRPGLLLRAPRSPHAQLQAEEERGREQAEAEDRAPPQRPLLGHGDGGSPCPALPGAAAPPQGSCRRRAGPRGRRRKVVRPRPERGRPGRGRDAPALCRPAAGCGE